MCYCDVCRLSWSSAHNLFPVLTVIPILLVPYLHTWILINLLSSFVLQTEEKGLVSTGEETPTLICREHIQMSRPSQPKLTTADSNSVSVIQSQAHAAASLSLQQVPQLIPATTAGGGKALPPSKMKKQPADKDSEEYRLRRERNNLAVKKSRMRSKQKAMDTQQRVNELKEENERLEAKIKLLSKELSVLKDLFLEHAHNLADNAQPPAAADGSNPIVKNVNGQ